MANTRKPTSLADVRKKATPNEVVVPVCVAGALVAEHARLDRRLEKLLDANLVEPAKTSRKLSDPKPESEADRLRKQIKKLEADIEAETFDFVFHKLPGDRWRDLMEEHGPREGKERQERFNPLTFPPAAVAACCVSPEGMDDPEQFKAFWDEDLNDGQRDDLFRGAQEANERALSVPFSVSAYAHQQSSEQSSTSAAG